MVGDLAVCVAHTADGGWYAIDDTCTHEDCSLSEGELCDHLVECPCHGSRFDVRTGAVHQPACRPSGADASGDRDRRAGGSGSRPRGAGVRVLGHTSAWSKEGSRAVTYVIGETCIDVKDKSCVEVCPVDCIIGTDEDRMLYIDPRGMHRLRSLCRSLPRRRHLRRGGSASRMAGVHRDQPPILRRSRNGSNACRRAQASGAPGGVMPVSHAATTGTEEPGSTARPQRGLTPPESRGGHQTTPALRGSAPA